MREYLPQKGSGGLDMMQRTATTQGNFDWQTEDDAMSKLMLALKLSPLLHAWFANAPFKEGAVSDSLSVRGHVWLNMDPARSGLIRSLWDMERPRYENYVQWALDAGMFLFFRDGQLVKNTGQTFRDFLENGFSGHRANLEDWKLHLNTLFPEVRLKNTLEVRSVDALPPYLALASLAVWTGVLYDSRALEEATALTSEWTYDELQSQRVSLCDRGLHTEFCGRTGFEWAEQVCEIAEAGLVRRGRGNGSYRDESIHLAPAAAILETRQHPADRARQAVRDGHSIIAATAVAMRRST
jgi:glutamate--cysteine ligase